MFLDINECASVNCLNGGTCLDSINSYSCQCAPSFTGNLCQTGSSWTKQHRVKQVV